MLLVLLRHGEDDRGAGDDPPLTERGVTQVGCTAEALSDLCPDGVEEVWISPARRTRETASLLREALLTGWDRVDTLLGPGEGVTRHLEIIERAKLNGLQSLLIVGHNPELGEVALRCVGESDEFERALLAHGECLLARLCAEDDEAASAQLLLVSGSSVRTLELTGQSADSAA
jgi:phosphohistidine phosphatase